MLSMKFLDTPLQGVGLLRKPSTMTLSHFTACACRVPFYPGLPYGIHVYTVRTFIRIYTKFGWNSQHLQMLFCNGKIQKPEKGGKPDEFEMGIGQTLLDLESNSELKAQLRDLSISGCSQIDVGDKKVCCKRFIFCTAVLIHMNAGSCIIHDHGCKNLIPFLI